MFPIVYASGEPSELKTYNYKTLQHCSPQDLPRITITEPDAFAFAAPFPTETLPLRLDSQQQIVFNTVTSSARPNVCLLGRAGSGKTSLIKIITNTMVKRGLCQRW